MTDTGRKLLITGFEPFGGESINPSWEAVRTLPDRIGCYELIKARIPVEFGRAAEYTAEMAGKYSPDVIICTGEAGGRSGLTPEMVAINLRAATIPDNAGYQPDDLPVVPDAPAAYFATIPVRRMAAAIGALGIPCAVSYSAGAYVCNDIFYTLLHRYSGTPTRVGFIHVPYLPEQAADGKPSLTLEDIVRALTAAIEAL